MEINKETSSSTESNHINSIVVMVRIRPIEESENRYA